MKNNGCKRIMDINCEKTYYIPNTKIRVEEHDPVALEKLWDKIDNLNSF